MIVPQHILIAFPSGILYPRNEISKCSTVFLNALRSHSLGTNTSTEHNMRYRVYYEDTPNVSLYCGDTMPVCD